MVAHEKKATPEMVQPELSVVGQQGIKVRIFNGDFGYIFNKKSLLETISWHRKSTIFYPLKILFYQSGSSPVVKRTLSFSMLHAFTIAFSARMANDVAKMTILNILLSLKAQNPGDLSKTELTENHFSSAFTLICNF